MSVPPAPQIFLFINESVTPPACHRRWVGGPHRWEKAGWRWPAGRWRGGWRRPTSPEWREWGGSPPGCSCCSPPPPPPGHLSAPAAAHHTIVSRLISLCNRPSLTVLGLIGRFCVQFASNQVLWCGVAPLRLNSRTTRQLSSFCLALQPWAS